MESTTPRRVPRSTSSAAGRVKTEQVVLEFLYKIAELIVQSRVPSSVDQNQRKSHRRARFSLDIEELTSVRDILSSYRDDVHRPLTVSISTTASPPMLLEQWQVHYTSDAPTTHSSTDVISQLKDVCKRIGVLLRVVHSFLRQMPAHHLYKENYTLAYSISDDSSFDQEAQINKYRLLPIATPFGYLTVTALYRENCQKAFFEQSQGVLAANQIIQDYIPPSPPLEPTTEEHSEGPVRRQSTPTMTEGSPEPYTVSKPMNIPSKKPLTSFVRPEEGLMLHSPKMAMDDLNPHAHSFNNRKTLEDNVESSSPIMAPYGFSKDSHTSKRELFSTSLNNEKKLTTPPRHPQTMKSRDQPSQASLENFSLDDPPSTAPSTLETSFGTPPPFSMSNPVQREKTSGSPTLEASPPFKPHPCELLSTSPGYNFSKQLPIRRTPTFATTNVHHEKLVNRQIVPREDDKMMWGVGSSPDSSDQFDVHAEDAEELPFALTESKQEWETVSVGSFLQTLHQVHVDSRSSGRVDDLTNELAHFRHFRDKLAKEL